MFLKSKIKFIPSLKIAFNYSILFIIISTIISIIIPFFLRIPSIMNVRAYVFNVIGIQIVTLLIVCLLIKIIFNKIDKWYILNSTSKYKDTKKIYSIRRKCMNSPYIILLMELIVPLITIYSFLNINGNYEKVIILKILLFVSSFLLLLSIYSFVYIQDINAEILKRTYSNDNLNIGFRIEIAAKFFMQVLPIFIACILTISFFTYSQVCKEKGNMLYSIYENKLKETFEGKRIKNYEEISNKLKEIVMLEDDHSKYIITPEEKIITIYGLEVNKNIIQTTKDVFQYNKTYQRYEIDKEGVCLQIEAENGTYYVGIQYNINSINTLVILIYIFLGLLILACMSLYFFTSSTFKQLSKVTHSFNNISKNTVSTKILPITSNDEIGDLIIAFNKIQNLNNSNLTKIKENQNKLMEKERLSSLGELIGGIAHNLKTPIMSISGATEALTDLVEEYNSSIDDPEVNSEDHKEIAKDMNNWIEKINSYTEYMSDVITAVKGQAVTFSDADISEFSIDELLKRINILMNHELKKAQANLNIVSEADEKTIVKGNINSLIQVINNMISNSIQAYADSKEKEINLSIFKEKLYVIIKIEDFAGGLTEEVSKKLFKKMITTKGKDGTGIGLFMSYANIKAQFNGDIEFTTDKGIGTTFYISIPYINN